MPPPWWGLWPDLLCRCFWCLFVDRLRTAWPRVDVHVRCRLSSAQCRGLIAYVGWPVSTSDNLRGPRRRTCCLPFCCCQGRNSIKSTLEKTAFDQVMTAVLFIQMPVASSSVSGENYAFGFVGPYLFSPPLPLHRHRCRGQVDREKTERKRFSLSPTMHDYEIQMF